MHLKQPRFTYSACGPSTKNKEIIQTFVKTGGTCYIYRNDLDITCFQHNMSYGRYKDLTKRTKSNTVLRDKAFKFASNPKSNGNKGGLASMVYKFFDKISKGISGIKFTSNQQVADELYKSIIRN